jgi:hypothetical protein
MPSQMPEDLSTYSLEEVITTQAENRAWSKELRLKSNALVNSRLAKAISQDEYNATRKVTHEETAECRRRAAVLVNEILGRTSRTSPR